MRATYSQNPQLDITEGGGSTQVPFKCEKMHKGAP
jgi:hypothetical protein